MGLTQYRRRCSLLAAVIVVDRLGGNIVTLIISSCIVSHPSGLSPFHQEPVGEDSWRAQSRAQTHGVKLCLGVGKLKPQKKKRESCLDQDGGKTGVVIHVNVQQIKKIRSDRQHLF